MEERQKQLLRRNRVALVERLKPSDLYDALLEKRLFSQDMIDEIKVRPKCCVPKYKFLFSACVNLVIRVVMVAVLRHQAGSGQAAGRRPGDAREPSLSVVPGLS